MKRNTGFTLIELLIVVAIIAILAAIAVPNFLEAQTRSKVSRAYADMRSISVALESYRMDHNSYPMGFINLREAAKIDPANYPYNNSRSRLIGAAKKLTTPVAYMTSMLIDPFSGGGTKWLRQDYPTHEPVPYWYEDYQPHNIFKGVKGVNGFVYTGNRDVFGKGYVWAATSMGPTRRALVFRFALEGRPVGAAPENSVYFAYDATNGTVSAGVVGRTNKGVFEEVNQE